MKVAKPCDIHRPDPLLDTGHLLQMRVELQVLVLPEKHAHSGSRWCKYKLRVFRKPPKLWHLHPLMQQNRFPANCLRYWAWRILSRENSKLSGTWLLKQNNIWKKRLRSAVGIMQLQIYCVTGISKRHLAEHSRFVPRINFKTHETGLKSSPELLELQLFATSDQTSASAAVNFSIQFFVSAVTKEPVPVALTMSLNCNSLAHRRPFSSKIFSFEVGSNLSTISSSGVLSAEKFTCNCGKINRQTANQFE